MSFSAAVATATATAKSNASSSRCSAELSVAWASSAQLDEAHLQKVADLRMRRASADISSESRASLRERFFKTKVASVAVA
ncbi:hypothetical protein RI054_24g102100 [Pseudoscourfieldia marina]